MPQRNLAVEMLERLLLDEIKVRGKRNVVLERRFSQLLESAGDQVPQPRASTPRW